MVLLLKTDGPSNAWRELWHSFKENYSFPVSASLLAASGILGLRLMGCLQSVELRTFDKMLSLQPAVNADQRLVIVGVTDADLDNYLGTATVSDRTMADLIRIIKTYQPRVIGLDFYRSLPNEPGSHELADIFASTPNLIGIEKVIGDEQHTPIPGHTVLEAADQLAASDIVVDQDGHVRRGLLFPAAAGPDVVESLGLRVALDYLAQEPLPIAPQLDTSILTFDEATFPPVEHYTGGYVDVDARGYQILLNLRQQPFDVVSFEQVLEKRVPRNLMHNRIVLIGSMALSSADIFYTANRLNNRPTNTTFGVELHGAVARQILSTVLDKRPLIYAWPVLIENLLIIGIAIGGGIVTKDTIRLWQRLAFVPVTSLLLVVSSYGILTLTGLWLPIIPMLLGLWAASALTSAYRTTQLQALSAKDKLTGLANRRTFDENLQQAWFRALRSQEPLALIIGDVDHFKTYNDTYGHPQGDECLKRVAQAIRTAVQTKGALAARYGGEEFVVLLPKTSIREGIAIANNILDKLTAHSLPHAASETADYVTMSMGLTSFIPKLEIPASALVEMADLGLYTAKKSGRNRVCVHQPDTLNSISF